MCSSSELLLSVHEDWCFLTRLEDGRASDHVRDDKGEVIRSVVVWSINESNKVGSADSWAGVGERSVVNRCARKDSVARVLAGQCQLGEGSIQVGDPDSVSGLLAAVDGSVGLVGTNLLAGIFP